MTEPSEWAKREAERSLRLPHYPSLNHKVALALDAARQKGQQEAWQVHHCETFEEAQRFIRALADKEPI